MGTNTMEAHSGQHGIEDLLSCFKPCPFFVKYKTFLSATKYLQLFDENSTIRHLPLKIITTTEIDYNTICS